MRRVTKENLIAQINRLRKIKDEQGQLSMSGEYTLRAYEILLSTMEVEPVGYLFHNEYGVVLYSISDDATEGFSLIGPIYSVPQPAPVVPECFVQFHDIIKERHYGRMPEEVQNAFDECAAMLNK